MILFNIYFRKQNETKTWGILQHFPQQLLHSAALKIYPKGQNVTCTVMKQLTLGTSWRVIKSWQICKCCFALVPLKGTVLSFRAFPYQQLTRDGMWNMSSAKQPVQMVLQTFEKHCPSPSWCLSPPEAWVIWNAAYHLQFETAPQDKPQGQRHVVHRRWSACSFSPQSTATLQPLTLSSAQFLACIRWSGH